MSILVDLTSTWWFEGRSATWGEVWPSAVVACVAGFASAAAYTVLWPAARVAASTNYTFWQATGRLIANKAPATWAKYSTTWSQPALIGLEALVGITQEFVEEYFAPLVAQILQVTPEGTPSWAAAREVLESQLGGPLDGQLLTDIQGIESETGWVVESTSSVAMLLDESVSPATSTGFSIVRTATTVATIGDGSNYLALVTPGLSALSLTFSLPTVPEVAILGLGYLVAAEELPIAEVRVNDVAVSSAWSPPPASGPGAVTWDVAQALRSGINEIEIALSSTSPTSLGLLSVALNGSGGELTQVLQGPPVLTAYPTLVESGGSFDLSWSPVPGAAFYVLEATRNRTYTDLNPTVTSSTAVTRQIAVSGSPITEYLRVKADNSPYSNEVVVTAIPEPTTGALVSNPPIVVDTGFTGSADVIQDLGLSIQGLSQFTWNSRTYVDNGPSGWLRMRVGSGDQGVAPSVRLDPINISTPGRYTGRVELLSSEANNSPLVVPVTFDVLSSASSGIDLVVDTAYWTTDREPCNPRRNGLELNWRVRNAGTQDWSSGADLALDGIWWDTSPDLTVADLVARNELEGACFGNDCQYGAFPAGATVINTKRFALPSGDCPVGRSYLYIVTDWPYDWRDGEWQGRVPEPNDTDSPRPNNLYVLEIYNPRPPQLLVQPGSLALSLNQGEVATAELSITNGGDLDMTWSASSQQAGIAVTPTEGVVSAGLSVPVSMIVNGAQFQPGTTPFTIDFVGNGGTASVDVTANVVAVPTIVLSPLFLSFDAQLGNPPPLARTVDVTNSSEGTTLDDLTVAAINYAADQPTGWLAAVFESGTTAPTGLTVRADPAGLPEGDYTGSVRVASGIAGVASQTIAVALRVLPPPLQLVTDGDLAPGTTGVTYEAALQASGGTGAFEWTIVSGALPEGLSLGTGSGLIAGTPITAQSASFWVRVTSGWQAVDKQFTLTINAPPRPDFAVDNLTIEPDTLRVGDWVTIRAIARNVGGATAEDIFWHITIGNPPPGSNVRGVVGDGTIPGLGAGDSTLITGSVVFDVPGSYTANAIVNPYATIGEGNWLNNFDTLRVSVLPALLPDLVPSALSGPDRGRPGQTVNVTLTESNIGEADAPGGWPGEIRLTMDQTCTSSGADPAALSYSGPALAAGSTRTMTWEATIPDGLQPGSYYWCAILDAAAGTVTESDENNNTVIGNLVAVARQFTMTVQVVGEGSVSADTGVVNLLTCTQASCEATVDSASTVVLSATSVTGWRWQGWSGACTGEAPTCQVTLHQAEAVTATFARLRFSLATMVVGDGRVASDMGEIDCPEACGTMFDSATVLTLTASAATGWRFGQWSGACDGPTPSCQLSMDSARSTTATFTRVQFPLTVTVMGSGSVDSDTGGIACPAGCAAVLDSAAAVILTATPATGWRFATWSGACAGEEPACEVLMHSARAATATFTRLQFPLTVTVMGGGRVDSDTGGIACPESCAGLLDSATAVTLTATPATGWRFSEWSGACAGQERVCLVVMDSTQAVAANFVRLQFPLTVALTGDGTVTSDTGGIACPTGCEALFDSAAVVTLTAKPGTGWRLSTWTGACSGAGLTCQVPMDSAQSVGATFARLQFLLTVAVAGNGAVTSTPAGITCPAGACEFRFDSATAVSLTAVAGNGWQFRTWSGACSTASPSCEISMDSVRGLSATFDLRLEVAVTCALNGGGCAEAAWRHLDALGNGDGVLNLGDFLAYLNRTGQAVSTSVMKAVSDHLGAVSAERLPTGKSEKGRNR